MKKQLDQQYGLARFDLPDDMAVEVGKIIVSWAFLEATLQRAIWDLSGVDERVGRIAVREPRATDRLGLICDLAELRDIKIAKESLKELRVSLQRNLTIRDLFAHGSWTHSDDHGWMIVRTKGTYPHQPSDHSKSRKVDPEALRANAADLVELRKQVDACVESTRNLCRFIYRELHPQN